MKFTAPAEDSNNYIRLKDKDSVKGVFRGDIFEFKKHWIDKKSEFCTGDNCKYCANDSKKPSFRFRLNLVVMEGGAWVPKIFEQGWIVYQALRDLNEEYPLEKTLVKVSRSGSTMNDTSYSILPVPKGEVTPAVEEALSKIELLDLKPSVKEEKAEPPQFDSEEEIPF